VGPKDNNNNNNNNNNKSVSLFNAPQLKYPVKNKSKNRRFHLVKIQVYFIDCWNSVINRKTLVKLRVSNHKLMIETGRYNQLLTTEGYVQFVTPMKLKMKFTSSAIARNISNLKMNFSLKYKVISIIFSSYLTRNWWLNWWTPKIFILIYDWRIIFHYWIICVIVSCHLRMMSLDYLLLIS